MTKEQIRKFTVLGALMTLWSDTLEQDVSEVIAPATQIEIQRVVGGVDIPDEDLLDTIRGMIHEACINAFAEEGADDSEEDAEYDEAASE